MGVTLACFQKLGSCPDLKDWQNMSEKASARASAHSPIMYELMDSEPCDLNLFIFFKICLNDSISTWQMVRVLGCMAACQEV
jgi:hypothetical protein